MDPSFSGGGALESSVLRPRFHIFSGCLVLALMGAAYTTFNVVGAVFASQMNLSAKEITAIANAGIVGSWLHLTNGPYVTRFGPRSSVMVGVALWVWGFGTMALAVKGILPITAAWQLALLNFAGMHGASFATMAALATVPHLYNTTDRPAMMAALGATFALGQAFIGTLYAVALRQLSLEMHFVCVCALGVLVMVRGASFFPSTPAGTPNAIAALTSVPVPGDAVTPVEMQLRDVAYRVIIAIAALFFGLQLLQLYAEQVPNPSDSQTFAVSAFSLLVLGVSSVCFVFMPSIGRIFVTATPPPPPNVARASSGTTTPSTASAAVALKRVAPAAPSYGGASQMLQHRSGAKGGGVSEGTYVAIESADENGSDPIGDPAHPSDDECAVLLDAAGNVDPSQADHTYWSLVQSVDFWLLLVSYFCCGGLASAVNATASLIVASLFPATAWTKMPPEVLIACGQIFALGALGRCCGALSIGRLTELARTELGLSRLGVCLCCHVLNVTAYALLYSTLSETALYVTIPLINFTWGTLYSSSQVVAVDTFGSKSFSTLWGALSSSPCVSTFLFAVGIAGSLADRHVAETQRAGAHPMTVAATEASAMHHDVCHGRGCYEAALGYFACIALVGLVSMVLLFWRRGGAFFMPRAPTASTAFGGVARGIPRGG